MDDLDHVYILIHPLPALLLCCLAAHKTLVDDAYFGS
jgi:hypothetical protein